MTNTNDMRAKHKKLVSEARQLVDNAKGDLSTEDNEKFNQLMAEADRTKENFERLERLETVETSLGASAGRVSQPESFDQKIDLPKLEKYSVLRAISKVAAGRQLDGLEGEISQEIERKCGKAPQGFYMPFNIPVEKYDLDLSAGTGAVGTVTDASNFIELLRNKMVVQGLGARVMTGLVGNLSIPQQTGGGTAYWVTEGNAPTESAQAIGQVALSPNTVGAFTDLTRKFVLQSSVDAEQFVRQDLATVLAIELDRAALNGSGTGAEPEGILQNGDVNSVTMATAAPTFAKIVQMESEVATDNADLGALAYVTNPRLRGKMKTTAVASNAPVFLWENNTVNGYRAVATSQIPSNFSNGSSSSLCGIIFGNFNDLVIGMWGGLDILVDPYTGSSAGTLRIVTLMDCDIALRHAESFCISTDAAYT